MIFPYVLCALVFYHFFRPRLQAQIQSPLWNDLVPMTIQYAIVMFTLEMWSIELTWETKQNQSHRDITQRRGEGWLRASCPLISPLISASGGMGSSIQIPAASDSPKAFIPLSHSLLPAKTVFQHCPVYSSYSSTAQNCWVRGFSSSSYWKSMMSPVLGGGYSVYILCTLQKDLESSEDRVEPQSGQ